MQGTAQYRPLGALRFAMTTADLVVLSTAQIQAFTTVQINQGHTPASISALTTTQIAAITTNQINAATSAEIQALTTSQIAALTTTQVAGLPVQAFTALNTSQLSAFSTNQITAMSASQIGGAVVLTGNPPFNFPVYSPLNMPLSVPPANLFPSIVFPSKTWTSTIQYVKDMTAINFLAQLTQAGTISIQRYADMNGTIAVGAAISQALTANTPGGVAVNDGLPYSYFSVSINNTSATSSVPSNCSILLERPL